MLLRLQRIGYLALILALVGCFRSAGDNFVPTPTPQQAAPTSIPLSSGTSEATPDTRFLDATAEPGNGDMTATFPPITVIAPTRVTSADLDAAATGTLQAQSTLGFITPGIPTGPITREPPTSTPSGGALTSTPSGLVTPTALNAQGDDACVYTVQPNDTLYKIATSRSLTVDDFRRANPDLVGSDPVLQPGQTLQIPDCVEGQQVIAPTALPAGPADSGIVTSAPASSGTGETYTVKSGDTLFNIAQRYGITVNALVAANSLANPDRLDIGQTLNIPSH